MAALVPGLRIYNALLLAVGVCLLPIALLGLALRRDWRRGLGERLGSIAPTAAGRPAVWIHGASVGEITALAPVVRMLRRDFRDHRLVVSTVTVGGRAAARVRVPEADDAVLLPIDLPWTVARALDAVAPRLVLFSETELWPNFLAALAERRVPAIMLSGRLSPRAYRRYRRWRWLFAPALASVRVLGVQSLDVARRLRALGAPAGRVVVTGSLKGADGTPRASGPLSLAALGIADQPVVVAASTHDGEEAALLTAWQTILAAAPGARLLLAPRRPERFADVAELLRAGGVHFQRRSALADGEPWPATATVLLLDTLGELAGLYAGARAAFVGGTLVPVGGHNLLEPAAAGVPVVFGPHVEHTADAARRLLAEGGGWQITDTRQLATVLASLIDDAAAARAAGLRAQAAAAAAEGPLAVTLALVRGALRAPWTPLPGDAAASEREWSPAGRHGVGGMR